VVYISTLRVRGESSTHIYTIYYTVHYVYLRVLGGPHPHCGSGGKAAHTHIHHILHCTLCIPARSRWSTSTLRVRGESSTHIYTIYYTVHYVYLRVLGGPHLHIAGQGGEQLVVPVGTLLHPAERRVIYFYSVYSVGEDFKYREGYSIEGGGRELIYIGYKYSYTYTNMHTHIPRDAHVTWV
jgi:hypothetical protein